jgi:hypothetical protein
MTHTPVSANFDADRALKEYTGDPDWMFKTGVGGMLTAACVLIGVLDPLHLMFVPLSLAIAAVICGYVLRNARVRAKKPGAPLPDWNDWGDLFMSGITWITVQFCISIVGCMIVGTTLLLAYYSLMTPGSYAIAIMEATFFAITLVLMWMHFLSTYLWMNFAVEERLGGGFALRKVSRRIRQNPRAFWLGWALSLAVQIAAVLIPAITIIGLIVVPSTFFAAQLVSSNLLAQAWRCADDD